MNLPRLLISGLSGGSGKTTITLGLARHFATSLPYGALPAQTNTLKSSSPSLPVEDLTTHCQTSASHSHHLQPHAASSLNFHSHSFYARPLELPWQEIQTIIHRQRPVQTFKKGPDYIDAAWLGLAAGCVTRTLDPYFSSPQQLRQIFMAGCHNASLALIEGNRGIHDGVDALGSCSSATLAKILQTPVLLVVDCTKMTRTVAALILGCTQLDPEVTIGGVILNKLGTTRQETIIRQAIEHYTNVPVLGAVPRQREPLLPERKLGLTAVQDDSSERLERISQFMRDHIDTDAIFRLASAFSAFSFSSSSPLSDPLTRPSQSLDPMLPASPRSTTQPAPALLTRVSVQPGDPVLTDALGQLYQSPPTTIDSSHATSALNSFNSSASSGSSGSSGSPESPQSAPNSPDTPNAFDSSACTEKTPSSAFATTIGPSEKYTPTIGYIYDEAVWFYYVENLEALSQAGARLQRLSLFDDKGWDCIDGLYIGGGQIDFHSHIITQSTQLQTLATCAHKGMPLYIEGTSLALACRELVINEHSYPMAHIFDASMTLSAQPKGLGYTRAQVYAPTPFFEEGEVIIGHQFNFFTFHSPRRLPTALALTKGKGLLTGATSEGQGPQRNSAQDLAQGLGQDLAQGLGQDSVQGSVQGPVQALTQDFEQRLDQPPVSPLGQHRGQMRQYDGLVYNTTFASLTHIYAPATPRWASRFVHLCHKFHEGLK